MWTNNYNPDKSDWYVAKINGKRSVLSWNKPNQFWSDFAGKTYKPEGIDCWLDDSKYDKKVGTTEFERFFIALSEEKYFISEADKLRMGDYLKEMKTLGIDTTTLIKYYPSYQRYYRIPYEEDNIDLNYDLTDEEKIAEYERLGKEADSLRFDVDAFVRELIKLSKLVVEKI